MTESPRDELASPELLSSTRGRLLVAGLVALALAVVAIATLRPDRQGVGTPTAGASPSGGASATPEASPVASHAPAPTPPLLTVKTGLRVAVVQGTKVEIVDVDTGRRSPVATNAELSGHERIDVESVGAQLVLVGDDQTGAGNGPNPVYATTDGPGSALRKIGEAGFLSPSDRPGRVWLSIVEQSTPPTTALSEVDLTGAVHRHIGFRGTFGATPFGAGFLKSNPRDDTWDVEWVDGTGGRQEVYRGLDLLTSNGPTAVLGDRTLCEPICELTILTADAAAPTRVQKVEGPLNLVASTVRRDGTRLVAAMLVPGEGPRPYLLTEVNLLSGRKHPIDDAWGAPYYGPSVQVSSDGRWLLFADADGVHVDAYDVQRQQPWRAPGTFDTITQLELLP